MWVFFTFIVLVILVLALINLKLKDDGYLNPYSSKKPLSQTEAKFYRVLIEALPECLILPQVQLSSFIEVDGSIARGANFYKYFNPIAQQSVDYLICLKDFTIVAAVELDDKSHLSAKAIERDNKKDRSLAAASIKLIRWHAESMPSIEEVRATFTVTTHDKHVDSNKLNEAQQSYFNKNEIGARVLLKQGLIKTLPPVIGIIVVLALLQHLPSILANSMQKQITAPSLSAASIQQLAEKQQRELFQQAQQKAIEGSKKQQELAAKEEAVQQVASQADIESRKAKAWEKYYQPSLECRSNYSLVTCGNEYARSKKQFDQDWNQGKID